MNILLSILLFIAVLILFLLFLASVIKKHYVISRDIVINKPLNEVFDYLKILRNQEKYNVWVKRDPHVKLVYQGFDGTIGFSNTWQGNKQAGKGEQEIKNIIANSLIHIELRFEEPFKNIGQTYLTTKSIAADQTLVTWKMEGKNKYPMNLMNIIIDGLLGKDIAQSLADLKIILER